METFRKKRFYRMNFSDPTFENDFWHGIASNMRSYSSIFTLLLVVMMLCFLIEDLAIGPKAPTAVSIGVWISYAVIIMLLSVLALFARTQWFLHAWTEWVCAVTLCVCGILLIMIGYP
jgi:hypothetical protein